MAASARMLTITSWPDIPAVHPKKKRSLICKRRRPPS
jgi:hypothetical protein